jgi:uncharacterized damage-inducible protein DinB
MLRRLEKTNLEPWREFMTFASMARSAAAMFLSCVGLVPAVWAQQAQAPAPAQPIANPISLSEKGFYMYVRGYVTAAAEKMPETNYSFKPTPEVRSFGQLVGHVADAQNNFCSMILGEKNPSLDIEKTKTSKADLVQALHDANTYCDKAYGSMTDADAATIVSMGPRKLAKITILSINTAHLDEHYGNMVTYMRLKGLVPPSSEAPSK